MSHPGIVLGDLVGVLQNPDEQLATRLTRVIGMLAEWNHVTKHTPTTHDPPFGGLSSAKDNEGHPEKYTLFEMADLWAWVIFTIVFIILILFDNLVLHRKGGKISFGWACIYTMFWLSTAFCFCLFVWWWRGSDDAIQWGLGYVLEWMLSVDNLFVFHLIFKLYCTPDELKHKPLFWGIVGAIVFRMLFFIIEEMLMHSLWWMHFVLGIFLIYTGIQTALSDDDEDDPRNNRVFVFLAKRLPLVNGYDSGAAFFVRVPVDSRTGEVIMPEPMAGGTGTHTPLPEAQPGAGGGQGSNERALIYSAAAWYSTPAVSPRSAPPITYKWRATLLLLVVICLEITDVIFAIDSVSAIVAQIPDLYLAYTACVFAMLGLRALFFVIDELVSLFSLLKYGVMLILVFIGVKLILKEWVHFPNWLVALVLVTTLAVSMIASVIYSKLFPESEDDEDVEKTTSAPASKGGSQPASGLNSGLNSGLPPRS